MQADRIDIDCSTSAIAAALQVEASANAPATLTLTAPVTLSRTGRAMRLVQGNGMTAQRHANPSLVRLLLRARKWWAMLREGELNIKQLAAAEGVQASYISRVIRLAFLSPTMVEAVLRGITRAGVDAAALTATDAVPSCWQAQAKLILPAVLEHSASV